MKEPEQYDIAIIGGGFSGTCTAYHLLRMLRGVSRVALFETRPEIGAGVAYQTESLHHLLNVRASGMSISSAEPTSFTDWLKAEGTTWTDGDFAPRPLYRRYLQASLNEAARNASNGVSLHRRKESIDKVSGVGSPYSLTLSSGRTVASRLVVLALGNVPFSNSAANDLKCPWAPSTYAELSRLQHIVIVGTALTALDILLQAEACGFTGRYTLVSRHGLLPLSHSAHTPPSVRAVRWVQDSISAPHTPRSLLSSMRMLAASGESWRGLVDSLRPHTAAIWVAMGDKERNRFLRHLRSFWEIHRHRAPESSLRAVEDLKRSGRLSIRRAKLTGTRVYDDRICLTLNQSEILEADIAVNGMGLFNDVRRTTSQLLLQLLRDGYAVPDFANLGVVTDDRCRLISSSRQIAEGLFTLGSLRRGQVWESSAVPELREQAKNIAEFIADHVRTHEFSSDAPLQEVSPSR